MSPGKEKNQGIEMEDVVRAEEEEDEEGEGLIGNKEEEMVVMGSLTALEILREAVKVLRTDSGMLMGIMVVLFCPVAAIVLPNFLLNKVMLKRLSFWMIMTAEASGFPRSAAVRSGCMKLAEMAMSFLSYVPLFITLWLFAKAAVVQSVLCIYAGNNHPSITTILERCRRIRKRLLLTCLCSYTAICGCVASFIVISLVLVNVFLLVGFPSASVMYPMAGVGLLFSFLFAHLVVICNLAMVVSVVEECAGIDALWRSANLIKGRTQVALTLLIGTNIGNAFVESLFQHRVNTLSYGDGSSRLWEGPLLVFMYSFIALIDTMMNCIFYFTCKSSSSTQTLQCMSRGMLQHSHSTSL